MLTGCPLCFSLVATVFKVNIWLVSVNAFILELCDATKNHIWMCFFQTLWHKLFSHWGGNTCYRLVAYYLVCEELPKPLAAVKIQHKSRGSRNEAKNIVLVGFTDKLPNSRHRSSFGHQLFLRYLQV